MNELIKAKEISREYVLSMVNQTIPVGRVMI